MIVAIHQPHYMPWLGYLHRMAQADLFILLDHVQFERRNYQNRGRIRLDGAEHWLTVPVVQRSQKERIDEKMVDNSQPRRWGPIHYSTLRHAYRQAEHFDAYAGAIRGIVEARWERLADLDRAMLELLRDAFGIRTPLANSSQPDAEAFARAGVHIRCHEFTHPEYRQCGDAPFIPGLASVDLLFNCGPQSRAILMGETSTRDLRAAA